MAIADIKQRPGVLLGAAILLHVVLISAQVNTKAGLPLLQVVTFGSFSEVQRGMMALVGGVRGLWTGYVGLQHVQAENTALKQELQSLQVRLQAERAEAQRTDNLRQLLELRERAGLDTTAAEVIAAAASPEFRTVTIDKGSSHGLQTDMAVISPAGVVGRVILPGGRASQVQLLVDRNAAAGALIERTRVQGVVMGFGDGIAADAVRARHRRREDGRPRRDLGHRRDLSEGLRHRHDRERRAAALGQYHEITVRPAVDFSRLEEVLVVRTLPAVAHAARGGEVRSAVALAAIFVALALQTTLAGS